MNDYVKQLEAQNEEFQQKLSVTESALKNKQDDYCELEDNIIYFIKHLRVKITEGHSYDDGTPKLGASMSFKYLVRGDYQPTVFGEKIRKLLDDKYTAAKKKHDEIDERDCMK